MTHREILRDARRELERVADAERRYLDGHPYRLLHAYDPRAAVYTVRVEVAREIPVELPPLAATVSRLGVQGLDALATALAGRRGAAGSARFPIHDTLPEFAQRSRRSLAAMPDDAQATIEALQPYHALGGFRNGALWLLRELNATGPSRLTGALVGEPELGVNTRRHVEITGALRVAPGTFEHGTVIASVAARVAGADPKLDLYLRAAFALAFASEMPASGAPLVATLATILGHIEHVVVARLEPLLRGG